MHIKRKKFKKQYSKMNGVTIICVVLAFVQVGYCQDKKQQEELIKKFEALKCKENEVPAPCGYDCFTCDGLKRCVPENKKNATCEPGCVCQQGFVKHEGKCIALSECPIKSKCPKDQILYHPCAPNITTISGMYIRTDGPEVDAKANGFVSTCNFNMGQFCAYKCAPLCGCKMGFVLKDDKCVEAPKETVLPTQKEEPKKNEPKKDEPKKEEPKQDQKAKNRRHRGHRMH